MLVFFLFFEPILQKFHSPRSSIDDRFWKILLQENAPKNEEKTGDKDFYSLFGQPINTSKIPLTSKSSSKLISDKATSVEKQQVSAPWILWNSKIALRVPSESVASVVVTCVVVYVASCFMVGAYITTVSLRAAATYNSSLLLTREWYKMKIIGRFVVIYQVTSFTECRIRKWDTGYLKSSCTFWYQHTTNAPPRQSSRVPTPRCNREETAPREKDIRIPATYIKQKGGLEEGKTPNCPMLLYEQNECDFFLKSLADIAHPTWEKKSHASAYDFL